jgi:hypothetical protein
MPSLTDAWLSEITDAVGYLTVSFLRGSSTCHIRYLISQNGRETSQYGVIQSQSLEQEVSMLIQKKEILRI